MSDSSITDHVETILRELVAKGEVTAKQIVVIGTSTSEVVGQHIGTAGAEEIAAYIYSGVERVQSEIGFYVAYQCCEHLNRALVVERELLSVYPLERVAAVPHPRAGGSMASYAYQQFKEAVLVETIEAHAGLDIGETLIGMHLRRVAVPVRPSIRRIGEASVTMAYTRPKYIGGPRAIYNAEQKAAVPDGSCS